THPPPLPPFLHDALPISALPHPRRDPEAARAAVRASRGLRAWLLSVGVHLLRKRPDGSRAELVRVGCGPAATAVCGALGCPAGRSEEHTSELQSPYDLVC